MRRFAAAVAAVACAAAVGFGGALRATEAGSPVVAACANSALPQAILDGPSPARGTRTMPLPVVTATGGSARLTLAVAADERSRDLGLMCVTRLRPHHGMIFVFDAPARQEFWMKNTLISLDMIWVGSDGRVTTIADHVPASTRTTVDEMVARREGFGAFVIELRAGEAEADGLVVGSKLSIGRLGSKH